MRNVTPKKNTGKSSEAAFENCLTNLYGKKVYIHRLQDAAALYGLNARAVKVGTQPSDYVVTVKGLTFYAEVKSSSNLTSFPFSCIKAHQLTAARRVRMAGGRYYFFIRNINTDNFYMLDSQTVDRVSKLRSSMLWSEMEVWTDYEAYKRK